MNIKCFSCNDFSEICYVISNDNNEAIVIDPGFCFEQERLAFSKYISDNNLTIKRVLNTHLHVDHILGNRFIQNTYGVGAEASEKDEPLLENMFAYASMFGLVGHSFSEKDFRDKLEANPLVGNLKENDVVAIDGIRLKVLEIPGHTMGHLAYYCEEEKCIFVGDILFCGSIGRTDLAGGDPRDMQKLLVEGIHAKILCLPGDTEVFPGHGMSTTVEHEKLNNMYL